MTGDKLYVTGVLGSAPRSLSGALKEGGWAVVLCAIVKRFLGGIVVSDPDPQYSALDRMDGLDRTCTTVTPPKP